MKNLLKFSLLFVFLSFFISSSVLAATSTSSINTDATQPQKAVLLATVNIQNVKITSQEGNVFKISFSISNREILQTGVKYGVQLIKVNKANQSIVDEYTYDESLTLKENTSINKEITYTAPAELNGDYSLRLTSKNSNGFPFAFSNNKDVTLISSVKGVSILTDSCTLSLNDKDVSKFITTGISLNSTDKLNLTCEGVNSSDTDIEVTPSFDTRYISAFGEVVTVPASTPITFKKLEKKSFSVLIPTVSLKPQRYSTSMYLKSGEITSNKIFINYSINGAIATISNLSLDKESYIKGDIANVSIYGVFSNGPLIKNDKGEITPSSDMTLTAIITNGNNRKCSAVAENKISPINQSPQLNIPIKITKDCINPQVSVTVKDDKGVTLAEQTFSFNTGAVKNNNIQKWLVISIVVLILIILVVYIYLKKKKEDKGDKGDINGPNSGQNTPLPPIASLFLFIALFSIFGLTSAKVASAETVALGSNYGRALMTYSIGEDNYRTGGTITATASFTYDHQDFATTCNPATTCNGGISNYNLPTYIMSVKGTTITSDSINDYHNMSGTFTASTTPGNYNATFQFKTSCPTNYRIDGTSGLCYNINSSVSSIKVGNAVIHGINPHIKINKNDVFKMTMGDGRTFTHYYNTSIQGEYANDVMSYFENDLKAAPYGNISGYYLPSDPNYSTADNSDVYKVRIGVGNTSSVLIATNAVGSNSTLEQSISYTVNPNPTVTVQANDANSLSVSSTTPVRITWYSANATSCICTYNKDASNPNYSCSPDYPSTGADGTFYSQVSAKGSPFTLAQTKTFTVTCTNVPSCHGHLTGWTTSNDCKDITVPNFCNAASGCNWY